MNSATSPPKVIVDRTGPVWVLTLNRPEVQNCVDGETAGLIEGAIDAFTGDQDARVLIVTGTGDRAFCTGADLKAAPELLQRQGWERSSPMGFARLDPGKPTIAAVNGYCFAGGVELACWCDWRVAEENAEFGILERRWGVPLLDGGTQRLPRIVGMGNALYLVETGVRIDANRALAMGLVQEVVSAGRALRRAKELGERIAGYPQVSLRADRSGVVASPGAGIESGLALERELGVPTVFDPELAEGLRRFASGDRPDPPRG